MGLGFFAVPLRAQNAIKVLVLPPPEPSLFTVGAFAMVLGGPITPGMAIKKHKAVPAAARPGRGAKTRAAR